MLKAKEQDFILKIESLIKQFDDERYLFVPKPPPFRFHKNKRSSTYYKIKTQILKQTAFLTLFTFATTQTFAVTKGFYIVKKDDVLSVISRRFFGAPVYGQKGAIKKVLALNPTIKNADLIYPGQKIRVSEIIDKDGEAGFQMSEVEKTADQAKESISEASPEQEALENKDIDKVDFVVSETTSDRAPSSTNEAQSMAAVDSSQITEPRMSDFDVSSLVEYSALQGVEIQNGTSGNLISGLNFGGRASWNQHWSPEWSTSFFHNWKKDFIYRRIKRHTHLQSKHYAIWVWCSRSKSIYK